MGNITTHLRAGHQFTGIVDPLDIEAAREIERLRAELMRFANWIDDLYGDLPNDRPPGPPRQLVKEMRASVLNEQITAKEK